MLPVPGNAVFLCPFKKFYVQTPFSAGIDFAPAVPAAAARTVEQVLGAAGLGAEKGEIGQGAITTVLTAEGEKFDNMLKMGEPLGEPALGEAEARCLGWFEERSFLGKGQVVDQFGQFVMHQ